MSKIYEDYKDVHVVATVVYVNDGKVYSDAEHENQYKTSALKEDFLKGIIIDLGDDGFVFPFGYTESDSVGSIQYIVPNGTTATSADIASAVAVADEA